MHGASARQPRLGRLTAQATHPTDTEKLLRRRCGDDAVSGYCFPATADSSADVRLACDWPAHAAAFGSAAPEAAVRCEAVRRSCCNDPEARFPRAANGRAPDNPDSNTAPSNRADIAFVCLAKPTAPAAEGRTIAAKAPRLAKAPKLAGLCAWGSSESRRIYTISCGAVANLWKTVAKKKRGSTSWRTG